MEFRIERTDFGRTLRFSGEISELDMVLLRLDPLDRALMDDVGGKGPPATAADHLLVLEMLYRRHAEQTKPLTKDQQT